MSLYDFDGGRNISLSTRRQNVLALLQDGEWHSTAQIGHPAIGGSEGMRRLRELRKMGYPIVKQRHEGHDDWLYQLLPLSVALRERRRKVPL